MKSKPVSVESVGVESATSSTKGLLLAKNVVWNLLGQGSPLVVALFAIPRLLHGLGPDRFGLLAVIWIVIGYFSIFDLGLGRALTQAVAQKLGSQDNQGIVGVVWGALIVMACLGIAGMAVVALISPWIVRQLLRVPPAIQYEAIQSFKLLAISIPVVVTTAGLRGVLEAKQRFDLLNAVRVPLGVFTYLGPLSALPFSNSLVPIVALLLCGRVAAWIVHGMMCLVVVPSLVTCPILDGRAVGQLLRFGSWMTVTNVVGPLMVYVDRLVVGAMVSVAAVAYYATPYELVTKLWLVPISIAGVLFPMFASTAQDDRAVASRIFVRGVKFTFALLFPAVLLVVSFAHEALARWIDPNFADHSATVLQVLAIGVFVNSLAQIPFALIQGSGRPDWTALLHLAELPLYLVLLLVLLQSAGIVGVAVAWVGRVSADAAVLFWLSKRFAPVSSEALFGGVTAVVVALASLTMVIFLPGPARLIVSPLAVVGFLGSFWLVLLSPTERAVGTDWLRRHRWSGEGD